MHEKIKRYLLSVLTLIFLFASYNSGLGQILDPVKWSFSSEKINFFHRTFDTDDGAELNFKATIDKGWHLYSQFIDDGGPIPTSFHLNASSDYKLIGTVEENGEVEKAYDPNFEMELKWFSHEVVFTQKIKILTELPFTVTGYLEFMCCNDEMCLPPKEVDFEFQMVGTVQEKSEEYVKTKDTADSPTSKALGMNIQELIQLNREYEEFANDYEPKADAVQFIARFPQSINIEVFYGDWCQDSRDYIPPFIKIMELADNPKITVGFIDIDREKKEPAELVHDRQIKYVPTFIMYINRQEIGRIVESPFSSMEDNLVAILKNYEPDLPVDRQGLGTSSMESQSNTSLWLFFFISILAGLAAILTPCVFPMIPMTVTFFMQSSDNRAKSITQALIYGFSIIVIYTAIGLIVAVTLGPGFINWLSTHWLPNIFFFALFAIFAASFFGMFEIVLPSWIVNRSDKQADKGGYAGAFFMALTLVLVSFSCTAPLVGGLLVEAATGEVIKPVVGMFGFSLAFAFPFTLLAFFPSWLSKLPKSGGWLNSVKVVLGFIILALGMKFLIIPDQTYHWEILDREIYLAIWIVIFTLMGFYLLGKIKLSHDSDLPYISVPRLALAIVTFAFVLYLIPGMFGAPLKAISGLLPPETSHDFDLKAIIRENMRGAVANRVTTDNPNICEEPKYADFLHFPHGLQGYFDYEQGLACAKKLNKPIFLDFNGHGCANCKDMEAKVWSDPEVLKRLREDFILIALYVDDKKELPEEDWITSTFDGKIKKTIGKKNADFQISRFKVNSQPYYVLLDHNEEMLTQKPIGRVGIKEFIDFLDKGKEEFKKRASGS